MTIITADVKIRPGTELSGVSFPTETVFDA